MQSGAARRSRHAASSRRTAARPGSGRTAQALEASEVFFQYYREHANYLERTYDFVERLGIEKVRKETVYAPEAAREALLDRFRKSKARAKDAWLEGQTPRHPTQFEGVKMIDRTAHPYVRHDSH